MTRVAEFRLARWVLGACFALCGCDGVGRALVESVPVGNTGDDPCIPMECRPIELASPISRGPKVPEFSKCNPREPALCDPASETMPGLSSAAAGVCRRTLSLDDDSFDAEAFRALSCAKLRMMRTTPSPQSGGDAVVLRVEDANWSNLELDMETGAPLTLELVRPQLEQLKLRLRGPFTLRVIDTESVTSLAVATDSASAAVELQKTDVKALELGDENAEFAGTLSVARSTIAGANVRARDLQLETVSFGDAKVEVEHSSWVDVSSRRVELSGGTLLFSASRLTTTKISRCELLSVYRSTATGYAFPPCSGGPTRLFESTLNRGSLDGEIMIDGSRLDQVVFGLNEPTNLQMWDGNLARSNFCAGTDRVVLAGQGSALCALCRELDGSPVPIDACLHEDAKVTLMKCCGVFDVAATCDPTPIRMRPPFN